MGKVAMRFRRSLRCIAQMAAKWVRIFLRRFGPYGGIGYFVDYIRTVRAINHEYDQKKRRNFQFIIMLLMLQMIHQIATVFFAYDDYDRRLHYPHCDDANDGKNFHHNNADEYHRRRQRLIWLDMASILELQRPKIFNFLSTWQWPTIAYMYYMFYFVNRLPLLDYFERHLLLRPKCGPSSRAVVDVDLRRYTFFTVNLMRQGIWIGDFVHIFTVIVMCKLLRNDGHLLFETNFSYSSFSSSSSSIHESFRAFARTTFNVTQMFGNLLLFACSVQFYAEVSALVASTSSIYIFEFRRRFKRCSAFLCEKILFERKATYNNRKFATKQRNQRSAPISLRLSRYYREHTRNLVTFIAAGYVFGNTIFVYLLTAVPFNLFLLVASMIDSRLDAAGRVSFLSIAANQFCTIFGFHFISATFINLIHRDARRMAAFASRVAPFRGGASRWKLAMYVERLHTGKPYGIQYGKIGVTISFDTFARYVTQYAKFMLIIWKLWTNN